MALVNFGRGTLSAIQAASKSGDVLYFATDAQALYLGDHLVTSSVSDASFAGNILTINKIDGSKISLDFSDVASAEGVNSLLATLRTSINENAATIADVSSHLAEVESQVTANKVSAADKSIDVTGSAIKANISSVAGNQLSLESDGLYVAKEAAYTGAEAISVNDHEISLVLDGSSLTQGAGGLKATLKLQKMDDAGEGNASGYQLVDAAGNVYGDAITIAADQFLKEVELDANDDLVFTFVTSTGEKTERVNIAKYIDTYTAGNGIAITDKKVSVVVKSGDKYLEVTADGVATKGIDAAIATAKGEAIADANAYTDGSINSVKGELSDAVEALEAADASNLAEAKAYTDASVNSLKIYVDTQDTSVLNAAKSDASTKASAAEQAAKSYADSSVSALKSYVNTQDASILNAAKTDATNKANAAEEAAKSYADASIANAVSALEEKIEEVQTNVDNVVVYKADGTTIEQSGTDEVTFSVKANVFDAHGAAATAKNEAIAAAKTYTDGSINSLKSSLEAADASNLAEAKEYTDGSINSLKSYVNTQDTSILNAAKAHTDASINALKSELEGADESLLAEAKEYTDGSINSLKSYVDTQDASILAAAKADSKSKADTALASAKTYTDGSINSLKSYVDTQDTSVLNAAKAYAKEYTDNALTWIEL